MSMRGAYRDSMPGVNKDFTSFSDRIGFGAHRGKTIAEIIESDPGWLAWAIKRDVVKVTHEIENEVIIELKNRKIKHY